MIAALVCEVDGCERVTEWPSPLWTVVALGVFAFGCWLVFRDLRE